MAENSKIEWCHHTFNPWRGCTKWSPGCTHCYAETLSKRNPAVLGEWGPGKPRVLASEDMWKKPLAWNKHVTLQCPGCHKLCVCDTLGKAAFGKCMDCNIWGDDMPRVRPRVFCASLADWLDDEVPIEWLARLLDLIDRTPNLDWLLLTKRPENWYKRVSLVDSEMAESWIDCVDMPERGAMPQNIWLGTTVEDQQRADERIPVLLSIPAKVRFLSCEPLLGEVDLTEWLICPKARDGLTMDTSTGAHECCRDCDWTGLLGGIDWVICGGESGPDARPMHPDWARSLRDQCQAAKVPFLFKQWGEWSEVDGAARTPGGNHISIDADGKTGKSLYRPLTDCLVSVDGKTFSRESLRPGIKARLMRRAHKAISGRLLDGIEHNGYPLTEGRDA